MAITEGAEIDTMANCPCCGHAVPAERADVEIGTDGLPLALATVEGLGLPVVDGAGLKFRVHLNGETADRCVGFDRERGKLWRYRQDYMRRDDKFLIEQVEGRVTLEPTN